LNHPDPLKDGLCLDLDPGLVRFPAAAQGASVGVRGESPVEQPRLEVAPNCHVLCR